MNYFNLEFTLVYISPNYLGLKQGNCFRTHFSEHTVNLAYFYSYLIYLNQIFTITEKDSSPKTHSLEQLEGE